MNFHTPIVHDNDGRLCGADAAAKPFVVDLFAGAGGFSLGAIQAGFEVRAAVENFQHAVATYRAMIPVAGDPDRVVFDCDILGLEPAVLMWSGGLVPGKCSLLLGGPPCQGYSTHRLKRSGVGDPRNRLLLRYLEFLSTLKPKAFLVENVPGLLRPQHASYLSQFLVGAESAGYTVFEPITINARDYGVPQSRKRVFILGYDAAAVDLSHLAWPPPSTHGSPSDCFQRGLQPWITTEEAFNDAPAGDPNNIHMNHGPELIKAFQNTPLNGGSRNQSGRTLNCHSTHNGHKDVYGRMSIDKPGPTITTACINPSKGRFVHPFEHHGITARQAARLQSFPDDFKFSGGLMAQGIQIGNAVPVKLANILCSHLLSELSEA